MAAAAFLCVGLPDTLGVESAALAALLDGLATTLDEAAVFDRLHRDDVQRVAGSLAWIAVLGPDAPSRSAVEVSDAAFTLSVRARSGLDGREWRDRRAVGAAFDKASTVLRRL